ncbi:uncharacterized protein GGS22DRAFT_171847 [Annulohypoxylon maeteangense]|uniref:uncharacterized protein n=1 Tax=Annulohypoxylon maeteangense TaxID=1927788 RepID=UPI002007724D|nr:uncharacterized protein GGS22DRAFT_171847 [Annulohypoxylon maeteangense]KAI0881777.1 hypothetical protein GGS22DRAFT_171847 [Annulohypoxylon maeteangense]
MGFTTGFTGGVTLTLSIAYLTVLAHQRSREHQAAVLRQQTYLLSSIIDPLPPALPPTRSEVAAAERAHFTEKAKDRWNSEVEGAVRWAQSKDWDEVREDAEAALSRLWAKAFSEAQEQVEKDQRKADAADGKLSQGKEKAGSVAAAAKGAFTDAKAKGSEVATKTGEKAEGTGGSIFGAIASGFSKAKSAIVGSSEKIEDVSPQLSAEEKALSQRYQKTAGLDRSKEEVLAARYNQQNNTQLKV